jgi:hypothetical protein
MRIQKIRFETSIFDVVMLRRLSVEERFASFLKIKKSIGPQKALFISRDVCPFVSLVAFWRGWVRELLPFFQLWVMAANLTPIKIPGKRKRAPKKPVSESSSNEVSLWLVVIEESAAITCGWSPFSGLLKWMGYEHSEVSLQATRTCS